MTQKLPLFPLNTVVFPGTQMPLHIFEERYRAMISRCLEQQSPFGIAMITQGRAEESEVKFCAVGTMVQISECVRLDDGRYYLIAVGQRRFRIQYLTQRLPYYIGSVTLIPEEAAGATRESAAALRTLYQRYILSLSAATGATIEQETLPEDTVELTYWMASRFQVENIQKQRWLEADVSTRLRELAGVLKAELALLPGVRPGGTDPNLGNLGSLN